MRKLIRSELGQSMVETAIVLPVVLLLLVAIVDAGRVFHSWLIVTNAAREGARSASAQQPWTTVEPRIEAASGTWLCDGIDLTCTSPGNNIQGVSGSSVTIQVSRDVTLLTPIMSALWGGTVTLTGDATMQLE
jgi:Flp pilus assembly protein TadG